MPSWLKSVKNQNVFNEFCGYVNDFHQLHATYCKTKNATSFFAIANSLDALLVELELSIRPNDTQRVSNCLNAIDEQVNLITNAKSGRENQQNFLKLTNALAAKKSKISDQYSIAMSAQITVLPEEKKSDIQLGIAAQEEDEHAEKVRCLKGFIQNLREVPEHKTTCVSRIKSTFFHDTNKAVSGGILMAMGLGSLFCTGMGVILSKYALHDLDGSREPINGISDTRAYLPTAFLLVGFLLFLKAYCNNAPKKEKSQTDGYVNLDDLDLEKGNSSQKNSM